MAVDWTSCLEVTNGNLNSAGDMETVILETTTELDTTQYDGTITYEIDIVMQVSQGTGTVIFEDDAGTDFVTFTTTSTDFIRLAEQTFTPNVGSDLYRLTLNNSLMAGLTRIARCSILIIQTDCTKTEFDVPLGNFDTSSTSGTLSKVPDDERKFWLFESAKFNKTITTKLHVTGRDAQTTGSVVLALTSDTVPIANSVVILNNATVGHFSGADFFSNLTNNEEYEYARAAGGAHSQDLDLHKVSIRVNISDSFSIIQMPLLVGHDNAAVGAGLGGAWTEASADTNDRDIGRRRKLTTADYETGQVTLFFEGTAQDSTPNGSMILVDDGVIESGTGGIDLIRNTITSSTPQRIRSGSFAITNDNRFYSSINPGTAGTIDGMNAWVLVEMSGTTAVVTGFQHPDHLIIHSL